VILGIPALHPGFPSVAPDAASAAGAAGTTDTGMSFASLLAETAGRTVGRLQEAERLSVDALQGKGDMRQVVDAVMNAEQSFQAAIAIRDKIVSAYLEVSRMAI
jgi:flagellar hook-basal body complex protein FliE